MTDAQKKLAATVSALLAALGIWVAAGKPTLPTGPSVPVAVSTWGCPDTLPEAIVIQRKDTAAKRVVCGGKGMLKMLMTHVEYMTGDPSKPLNGNTVLTIMDVPAKSMGPVMSVDFVKLANEKYALPRDSAAFKEVGMSKLIKQAIGLPDSVYPAIMLRKDSATVRVASTNVIYYIPVEGSRENTWLQENRGSCWGGDPDTACVGKPPRVVTTWLDEFKPAVPTDGVLELYVRRDPGVIFIPSLNVN